MMKKIAIIGIADVNASVFGFNVLCDELIKNMTCNFVFYLYHSFDVFNKNIPDGKRYFSAGNKTVTNIKLPKTGKLIFAFIHALFNADVLFVNGTRAALFFPIIRFLSRKKIVLYVSHSDVNYRSRTNNMFNFSLNEKIAFFYCHSIITNADSIKEYIAAKYNLNAEIIDQGVNHVERIESTFSDHKKFPFLKYMYAFSYFESGNHKQVEVVLNAFKQTKHKYLVIIGDWSSTDYGISIKNKYAGYANIFMLHTIHDQRQLDLIRSNAILYIHSSVSAENSMSMLESMRLGLPVLAIESVDNKYLTEGQASYFKNLRDVNYNLSHMNIERLRKNAGVMGDIILKRFDWSNLIPKYEKVFNRLFLMENNKSTPCPTRSSQITFFSVKDNDLKPRLSFLKTILNFFI